MGACLSSQSNLKQVQAARWGRSDCCVLSVPIPLHSFKLPLLSLTFTGESQINSEAEQIVIRLPRTVFGKEWKSRIAQPGPRTLTTCQIQLQWGRYISISHTLSTAPRLSTCPESQIGIKWIRLDLGSALVYVAASRQINPYSLACFCSELLYE
jgi:hypothetical protein